MTWTADPRIDAYIAGLPDWQQAICREVRELVHAADPEVEETIKRTRQPYFVLQGNICALLAAKDHVNVFLYDGAIVPDPEGIITAGHANKTARTVARPARRDAERACAAGDVQADHRQQPRRRLAQAQGRVALNGARGQSPRMRWMTSSGRRPSSSASGFRMTRWRSTGAATALTSSGVT